MTQPNTRLSGATSLFDNAIDNTLTAFDGSCLLGSQVILLSSWIWYVFSGVYLVGDVIQLMCFGGLLLGFYVVLRRRRSRGAKVAPARTKSPELEAQTARVAPPEIRSPVNTPVKPAQKTTAMQTDPEPHARQPMVAISVTNDKLALGAVRKHIREVLGLEAADSVQLFHYGILLLRDWDDEILESLGIQYGHVLQFSERDDSAAGPPASEIGDGVAVWLEDKRSWVSAELTGEMGKNTLYYVGLDAEKITLQVMAEHIRPGRGPIDAQRLFPETKKPPAIMPCVAVSESASSSSKNGESPDLSALCMRKTSSVSIVIPDGEPSSPPKTPPQKCARTSRDTEMVSPMTKSQSSPNLAVWPEKMDRPRPTKMKSMSGHVLKLQQALDGLSRVHRKDPEIARVFRSIQTGLLHNIVNREQMRLIQRHTQVFSSKQNAQIRMLGERNKILKPSRHTSVDAGRIDKLMRATQGDESDCENSFQNGGRNYYSLGLLKKIRKRPHYRTPPGSLPDYLNIHKLGGGDMPRVKSAPALNEMTKIDQDEQQAPFPIEGSSQDNSTKPKIARQVSPGLSANAPVFTPQTSYTHAGNTVSMMPPPGFAAVPNTHRAVAAPGASLPPGPPQIEGATHPSSFHLREVTEPRKYYKLFE